MRRIIDLTYPISAGMPVFPGDPEVTTRQVSTITGSGFSVNEVTFGTHTGTHVDAPRHALLSDHAVDSLSLDVLTGWAEVLDLKDGNIGEEITAADFDQFASRVGEGARLIVRTGWSSRFGSPGFFNGYPGISEGAVAWLAGRKVSLLAVEQPSVDTEGHSNVHKALLTAKIVVIENLTNLASLTQDRVYLVALPMNLVGMDGAPVRAIAIEGVDVST